MISLSILPVLPLTPHTQIYVGMAKPLGLCFHFFAPFFFFFTGPGQDKIPFYGLEPLKDEEVNTLNKEGSSSYPQE